jgi:hypothetical protein
MSISHPPVGPFDARATALKAQATSGQDNAPSASIHRLQATGATVPSTVGWSGLAALASGAAVAVGGTAWAIQEGVSQPLAIMVGYCALVGSTCLCAALTVIRGPAAKSSPTAAKPRKREPNYAAWNLVSKLSISDASRLWCDIEPGCPASQESIAWGQAMLDAVKRGELPISAKAGASQSGSNQDQRNPNWHTEIARDALKSWAKANGHAPRFLQK